MGAFEETKCRRSIVSDTFESLKEQARRWRGTIDLLEAGQRVDRDEALSDLGRLLDACQNLRDAILSEDSGASWKTTAELQSLVDKLDDVAERRKRYLDLAQLLVGGTVSHRRERTKQERLRQRDAAVAELMEVSALPNLEALPGPAVDGWLEWACSLDDSSNDPDLGRLKSNLPRVDEFISQLEIEMWQDGSVSIPQQMVDAVPEIRTQPETKSEIRPEPNFLGTIPQIEVERPGDSMPDGGGAIHGLSNSLAAVDSATHTVAATAEAEPLAIAETAPAPKPAKSAKKTAAQSSGKLSFFDPEDIDEFKRHAEEAKGKSKTSRNVRALLGVSQWLLPSDQNPLLHPSCGIRAQIAYNGSSDLLPVSPEDAERAIEAESGLLLFTGGADLLRWSIGQRVDEPADGVAAIRRLRMEQIRSWFTDVYKIELAEPQILDMYRMTTGIPILIGELHRLVLPNPKMPPTWLGYAIWTNVKSAFERRLPVLARELRNGSPAVRLTEQEIRILKMVTIASDNSTPENLLKNLRDHWDKYHRPEIEALNAGDEPRVKVLQDLGLLPVKNGVNGEPFKALMPVGPEDALRQIVGYL